MRYPLALSALFLVFLAGCGRQQVILPEGPQTVSGTLLSTSLSLVRRGTHVLKQRGETVYFIESTAVNLRAFEGQEVSLSGLLEANTEEDALPVLIVTIARSLQEEMKNVTIEPFGLLMAIPKSWSVRTVGQTAELLSPAASGPVLILSSSSVEKLSFDPRTLAFRTASGTTRQTLKSLVIDARRAVRLDDAALQSVKFYLERSRDPQTFIVLSFAPSSAVPAALAERIATSVRAASSTSSRSRGQSASTPTTTGSGARIEGKPCGGPAGILCPAGYFCLVTDTATDIGGCKRI